MKPVVRDVLSVVAGLAGVAAMAVAMHWLLNTGSCASGGPYLSRHACPPGTVPFTLVLVGGVLVWLAGIAISRNGLNGRGTGQWVWVAGFVGLGVAAILKSALQDSMPADARLGSYIMGGVFIPVGLGILVQRRSGRTAQPQSPGSPGRRLRRLHDNGVIDDAQYQRLRAVLTEPGTPDRLGVLERAIDDYAKGLLTAAEYEDRKRSATFTG
ncbi:SHOCT domain-containing protein [Dactylosporangium matsuzakiense]|uniref:SHOCT domain-containing protein n=1 Tax=Dactylosporangium matsuzakiense TaxID=53360 RepID=UPI0021C478A2|nr:SHOCT domain-containing protein [Dactylosporangium matsuzakiense]UWZ47698.1 SHOCT domain-containing protein [Dactylosporangium matsuzakiense]